MPHSVASDLSLHCLSVTILGVSSLQWVKTWLVKIAIKPKCLLAFMYYLYILKLFLSFDNSVQTSRNEDLFLFLFRQWVYMFLCTKCFMLIAEIFIQLTVLSQTLETPNTTQTENSGPSC